MKRKETAPTPARLYRGWVLALLMLTYMSSYVDRSIVGILQESIKHDLRLSDGQLGMLGGLSFALLYSTLAIPVARLAERYSRVAIIGVSVLAWSAMTTLCGFSRGYTELFLARMGVGVGEAGGNPAAHSLIGDLFSDRHRATALSIFSLGAPLGSMAGAILGGEIGQAWGWRTALMVVGPAGIALALLLALTVREPPREAARDGTTDTPPLGAVLRLLLGSATFRHLAAGSSLVVLGGYCIALFLAPYLLRTHGITMRDAGYLSALVNGLAAGLGVFAGGFVTDLAARRDRRAYVWLPALWVGMSTPLFIAGLLVTNVIFGVALMMAATLLIYTYYGPTFAVLQALVEPRMRATAAALMFMIMNLVGVGLGPPLVGLLSDRLAARAFGLIGSPERLARCVGDVAATDPALAILCAKAQAIGLQQALVICALIFLVAAAQFLMAGRTMPTQARR